MIFGGIQKNSLIDYPGKISCVLFTSGCNFTCPYCHNPDLAKNNPSVFLEETEIYAFLESRKGFLDGVVISGGEPTLCDDIESVCRKIKVIGYPVKLDTNGSCPSVVKNLIDANFIQNLPWNSGITDGSYGVSFNSTSLNDLQDQFLNLTPNNLYSYEAGQPTPYKRDIVIVNKGDEIQVNSIVTWQIRGGSYSITLEDHFFNWRPYEE